MGSPQFLSVSEAAAKLGKTEDEIKDLARDGKLREFRDRGELFFKTEEVEQVAAELGQAPAVEDTSETISLDDSSVGSIPLTDESPPEDSGVGASTAGGTALSDTALGGTGTDDTSVGASHAGTPAATPAGDSSASGYDLSEGSSVGLSGTDMLQEAASPAQSPAGEEEDGVGFSDSGLSLDELDEAGGSGAPADAKGDTVITSAGISIFDGDEDAPFDADPQAETQVTTSPLDDDSGYGSGSGLLDLTRESDDTSLGAELLDEIYPGEEESTLQEDMPTEVVPSMPEGGLPGAPAFGPGAAPGWTMVAPPPADPAAAGFTGMMVVGVVVMALTGTVLAAAVQGVVPSFLSTLYSQWIALAGGGVGLAVVALLIGWVVGKQMVGGQAAPARATTSDTTTSATDVTDDAAEDSSVGGSAAGDDAADDTGG